MNEIHGLKKPNVFKCVLRNPFSIERQELEAFQAEQAVAGAQGRLKSLLRAGRLKDGEVVRYYERSAKGQPFQGHDVAGKGRQLAQQQLQGPREGLTTDSEHGFHG